MSQANLIPLGVAIVFTFRRRSQSELHRWSKVIEDASPGAFVVCAATVAFVDHDEVEKVGWVFTKIVSGGVPNFVIPSQAGTQATRNLSGFPPVAFARAGSARE